MAEHRIDELLGRLDDHATPDAAFDQQLRARLRAVLSGAEVDDTITTEEVFEMDTTVTAPPVRRPRWLPAAAAAAIAVVVGAGVLVVAGDDKDGETDVAVAPETSFVGASVEQTTLSTERMPFFVSVVGEHAWVLALDGQLHSVGADGATAVGTKVNEASTMAAGADAVWIADTGTGDVVRVDAATGEVVARIATGVGVRDTFRIPMPEGPSARPFADVGGITVDGSSVWVGDLEGEVLHVDAATNQIDRRLPVPVRPEVLRIDGDRLLVANLNLGEVAVMDAATGDVLASRTVDGLAGVALRDGVLYLQNRSDSTITRVDLTTGDEVQSAPLGRAFYQNGVPMRAPMPVVSDGGLLVDVAGDGESIRVLDPDTLEVLDTLDVVDGHGDMTLAPDGSAWLVRARDHLLIHLAPARGGDA